MYECIVIVASVKRLKEIIRFTNYIYEHLVTQCYSENAWWLFLMDMHLQCNDEYEVERNILKTSTRN